MCAIFIYQKIDIENDSNSTSMCSCVVGNREIFVRATHVGRFTVSFFT